MPSTSIAQNRAMHAAASGHSTLGIPPSVGQEFVAADARSKVRTLPERVGRKRVRRGKRGKGGDPGDPRAHHKNLSAAMDAGDHAGARRHAFALVRAIDHHHPQRPPMRPPTKAPPRAVPAVMPKPAPKDTGSGSRLAEMLKRMNQQ